MKIIVFVLQDLEYRPVNNFSYLIRYMNSD